MDPMDMLLDVHWARVVHNRTMDIKYCAPASMSFGFALYCRSYCSLMSR